MTIEERLVQAEEALALERAKVRELATSLAAAVQAIAEAEATRARVEEADAHAKALRRERNRRYQEAKRTGRRHVDVSEDVVKTSYSLPPPSPSPSLPAPISPPPLSSPNPLETERVESENLPDATECAEEVIDRPALILVPPRGSPKDRKQREPSKAEKLYFALQGSRRTRCDEVGVTFIDDGWKPARINRDLGPLARLEGPDADRLNAAWAEYLADESRAGMDVPWSLGYFLASRSTWEGKALKAAGGP